MRRACVGASAGAEHMAAGADDAERRLPTGHSLRNSAEAALRDSEARFRAVANLVPDLLWQSDPAGSTLWFNDRWYEYTRQRATDAVGFGWLAAVHPNDRESSRVAYAAGIASGRAFRLEHRVRGADGIYRWHLVRAEPVRDDSGAIISWFGAATDVHDHRVMLEVSQTAHREADLARAEVEQRVEERTAELARMNAALKAEASERARAERARRALRRQLARAEEEQRRRLSRELHDQLGQHLTALALGLDETRRLVAGHESVERRVAQLQDLARMLTRDARHLALELRPPELDDLGLASALATYVEQWALRYRIAAEVEITGLGERQLSGEVGTALYRIVQEALTNVAKHAQATQVSVIVDKRNDDLALIIEDDGCGFDVDAVMLRGRSNRGLGLAGMRERAAMVGAQLTVESAPGSGTALYVRLPHGGDELATAGGAPPAEI